MFRHLHPLERFAEARDQSRRTDEQVVLHPASVAIMSDCTSSQIGVWSENSSDRTVVVAVYGQPGRPIEANGSLVGPENDRSQNVPIDPSPEYDASDELEYGLNWFAWA